MCEGERAYVCVCVCVRERDSERAAQLICGLFDPPDKRNMRIQPHIAGGVGVPGVWPHCGKTTDRSQGLIPLPMPTAPANPGTESALIRPGYGPVSQLCVLTSVGRLGIEICGLETDIQFAPIKYCS